MRKQVLFIIVILALTLSGCAQQTEEQPETPGAVSTVIEQPTEQLQQTLKETEEASAEREKIRLAEEAVENAQIEKDMELFNQLIQGNPTASDCDKLKHPQIKADCLEFVNQ